MTPGINFKNDIPDLVVAGLQKDKNTSTSTQTE